MAARPALSGRSLAIFAGWAAAVALDALWNHSETAGGTGLLVSYAVLFAALLAVIIAVVVDRQRVIGMITNFLPDFEQPEVVTAKTSGCSPTSGGAARAAWARLELGIAGKQAMTQYQLAATELAAACHRKSLGQTTEDIYLRHRDDSLALMRVRGENPPPGTAVPAPLDRPRLAVCFHRVPPHPAQQPARVPLARLGDPLDPPPSAQRPRRARSRLPEESWLDVGSAGHPLVAQQPLLPVNAPAVPGE